MKFIHSEFHGGPSHVALVTLDAQANVMLLDDQAFSAYQQGATFSYLGGWATRSPVHLVPPHSGHWHVVVDLGGAAGRVEADIRILQQELC